MEDCSKGDEASGGGGGNCRWNPTKEQISLLEGLYKQGIRTPSAEQIQQITTRLRAYGHIEGKNVFYWFQNHKARQRQKQKQESLVYINRFLHAAVPTFVPPPPNVVCSPSYAPHGGIGYYAPFQKILLPPFRRPRMSKTVEIKGKHNQDYRQHDRDCNHCSNGGPSLNSQETLQLFPLHPTGLILEKDSSSAESLSPSSFLSSSGDPSIFSDDSDVSIADNTEVPFINFFSQYQN